MTIKTHGRMMTNKTIGADQLAVSDYGTDNQALVTDGAGTIRWATVGVGGSVGSSTYVENIFTGNGVLTKFQMTATAALEESVLVFVDGVAQPTSAFTLSSSGAGIGAGGNLDEINISPAVATGQQLRVCHLGINTAIADGSITGAKLSFPPAAAGDLLYHNGTQYDRFPIGTKGQLFATNAGATAPEWILGDDAGDILFYDGTNYQKLAIGTAGQLLATNPGATAPYWLNADNQNLPSVGASGNVLTSDATNWSSQPPLGGVGGELVSVQMFDGTGGAGTNNSLGLNTWTKPAGVTKIEVWVVGGGGRSYNNGSGAIGGGAAGTAYAIKDVTNITSLPLEVGHGGGSSGNGVVSTFGDIITVGTSPPLGIHFTQIWGDPGQAASNFSGGAGGIGQWGDISHTGQSNALGNESWFGGTYGRGANAAPTDAQGNPTYSSGQVGCVFIKEYSDASASLIGDKLVSTQLFDTINNPGNPYGTTWTKPAGVTKIEVFVVGGGGSATVDSGLAHSGNGGGAGTAYSILDVTNITSATMNIGRGGYASNFAMTGITTLNGSPGGTATGSSGSGAVHGVGGVGTHGNAANFRGGTGGSGVFGYGEGAGRRTTEGTSIGDTGCVYIKEYSDASLVSGGSLVPTGVVNPYAGATAPAGWLLCFGQAISRTVYSTLFTAIGTVYGVGDGSTTFLLPDMRGRVAAGQDDMGGTSANRLTTPLNGDTLGAAGGTETASHTHVRGASVTSDGTAFNPDDNGNLISSAAAGTIQPTIILNYIIKT